MEPRAKPNRSPPWDALVRPLVARALPTRGLLSTRGRCPDRPRPRLRASGRNQLRRGRRQRVRELSARADAELLEHLAEVVLDRARAEVELRRDLRVREAVGRE